MPSSRDRHSAARMLGCASMMLTQGVPSCGRFLGSRRLNEPAVCTVSGMTCLMSAHDLVGGRRWTEVELCCSSRSFGRRERWSNAAADLRSVDQCLSPAHGLVSGHGSGSGALQHQSTGMWLYVDPRSPSKAHHKLAWLIFQGHLCNHLGLQEGGRLLLEAHYLTTCLVLARHQE